MVKGNEFIKGKGAQFNPTNKFEILEVCKDHEEGIDEPLNEGKIQTKFFQESPKTIINKISSPDIPFGAAINPYQGCEHGCVYCYARNSHQYYGFSAGLDFESKIVVKKNVSVLLEKELLSKSWKPRPIMLSSNTDCYQPVEKKLKITRKVLQVFLKYRHPVSLITKNALILRDLDILQELARYNLVHVMISVTSLNEELRGKLEPRTSTAQKRLETIELLTQARIPTGAMLAPMIPSLNLHEISSLVRKVSEAGAISAAYTVVRLNDKIAPIFEDWLRKAFPDRADKVWHQIQELHGGNVYDSRFKTRMTGSGNLAIMIKQMFDKSVSKYMQNKKMPPFDLSQFRKGGMYTIF